MKLNRRELRRLIESVIREEATTGKRLIPSEVRQTLNQLRLSGATAWAFDEDANRGLAINMFVKRLIIATIIKDIIIIKCPSL